MRVVISLLLTIALSTCGPGLSEPKVQSLVQDYWRRHGDGVPLNALPFICSERGGGGLSRQCYAAAACVAPIVSDLPSEVIWEERGMEFVVRRGNDPMLSAQFYYPLFEPTIVRVIEVTDDVAEGLSPTETASGTAKLQVRLTLSRYARAVQDCPGLAAILSATAQPVTMRASLIGRQVNRGSGVQIEWSIDNMGGIKAWPQDQPDPLGEEGQTTFSGTLSCTLNAGDHDTSIDSELTLNLTGNLCVNGRTRYTRTNDEGEFRRLVVNNDIGALDVLAIDTEAGVFRRERYLLTPTDLELANAESAAANLSQDCVADEDGDALRQRNERLSRFVRGQPQEHLVYSCQVQP